MRKIKDITGSATSVTIAVFLSRILGLVREQVLAYFFGATNSMDAFVVAYRIPNLLRDLFAEGALSSAFVKVFSTSLVKKGKEESFNIASTLISNFLIVLLGIVGLGIVFAKDIVALIAPDFKAIPEKYLLTVHLTQIMMPFLLLISLSSIVAGMLNTFGMFFLPAFSSALFNLTFIITGVTGYFVFKFYALPPIYGMALGVILGGLVQFSFQYPLLRKKGFVFKFKPDFSSPEFKDILKLVLPMVFGLSVVQVNIFINTYFATSCGKGAVSWYAYAFRIMYVPLGLFGIGLSQALLPELSKQVARKEFTLAKDTFSRALVVSLSLSLPSAIGLWILSKPIVAVLFQRGRFTLFDTLHTASLLKIFALSLPFYGITKTTVPFFYSVKKTYIPATASLIAVVTNVFVILLTIKNLGINGVALGTTTSLVLQSLFLTTIAFYMLKLPDLGFVLKSTFALCLAGTALAFVLEFILKSLSSPLLVLLAGIPVGAIAFVGTCKLLGPEETFMFFEHLIKKFRLKP